MIEEIERRAAQIQDAVELIRAMHGAVIIERNSILQMAVSLALAVQSGNEAEIARLSAAILVFGDQTTRSV